MDGKKGFGVIAMSRNVWAIKHRPDTLEGIVGQEHITDILQGSERQHLILYSSGAGTGKTSLAYALGNEWGCHVETYNASSKFERGIEFIEKEVIPMARNGYYSKIFLLDEADQLTPAAQSALKGVIENAHGYFILTCNNLGKITPYLKSRCRVLEFNPISQEAMVDRLAVIAGKEGVEISANNLGLIAKIHKGDLRAAINFLQAYASVDDSDGFLSDVTATMPQMDFNKRILELCFRDKDFEEASELLWKTKQRREAILNIFDFAMDSTAATPANKMRVVEATINAERDFALSVEERAVVYNFIRELC